MKGFLVLVLSSLLVCVLAEEELLKTVVSDKSAEVKGYGHSVAYYPVIKGDKPPRQEPCVWKALKDLKGDKTKKDPYPYLLEIPQSSFRCDQVYQPGFYADIENDCQVVRRCDPNTGGLSSYLCPIGTIFNQITLVCDWWYNVDCDRSKKYQAYSNSRLYHADWVLLDDCEDYPSKHDYDHDHDNDNNDHEYEHQHKKDHDDQYHNQDHDHDQDHDQDEYKTTKNHKYDTKKPYKTTTRKVYETKPTTIKYAAEQEQE